MQVILFPALLFIFCAIGVVAMTTVSVDDQHLKQAVEQLSHKMDELSVEQLRQHEQLKTTAGVISHLREISQQLKLFSASAGEAGSPEKQQQHITEQLSSMRNDVDLISGEISKLRSISGNQNVSTQLHWLYDNLALLTTRVDNTEHKIARFIQRQDQHRKSEEQHRHYLKRQTQIIGDSMNQLISQQQLNTAAIQQLQLSRKAAEPQLPDHKLLEKLQQKVHIVEQRIMDTRSENARSFAHGRISQNNIRHRSHEHKIHKSKMHAVFSILNTLHHKYQRIETNLAAMRENINSIIVEQLALKSHLDNNSASLVNLREQNKLLNWRLNISCGDTDALREIQTSTTNLIREMDAVETKHDAELTHVKSEIARLDVNCARLGSNVDQISDVIKRLPQTNQQMNREIKTISDFVDENRRSVSALQGYLLSRKVDCCVSSLKSNIALT